MAKLPLITNIFVLTNYLITFDYFKFVSILLVIIQRSKYFENDPNMHILV